MPRITNSRLVILFLTLLAVFSTASTAKAQQPTPSDDAVNAIARQLFCPVCENTPLDVCPTQACAQWRELIREKLADGWSEEQIKNYFVDQYGARVIGIPPAEGQNLLLYIFLFLILIVSALVGVFFLYKAYLTQKQSAQQPAAAESVLTPASNEYIARMEEELKKRD